MSLLEKVEGFAKEVDEKADERFKYFRIIQWGSFIIATAASFYIYLTAPFNEEIVRYVLTPLLGAGIFMMCLLTGSGGIIFLSGGEVALRRALTLKPKLQNFVTLLRLVGNSPDNNQTLKAIKLMNDIQEKNGFVEYVDSATIFESYYKRLGRVENESNELKKRIENLEASNLDKDRMIARQNQDIFREKWERMKLKQEVEVLHEKFESFEKERKEDDQLFNEKTKIQNNVENTNSITKSNKIEFLDE